MEKKTKTGNSSDDLFPYRSEDLEPRHTQEEIAAEDAFIERNRKAINKALSEGYSDVERGKTVTLDEARVKLAEQREARAKS
jgi:hypothetical protein